MSKVLIIGASSGIGEALAELYLQRGDSVTDISRRDCPNQRVFTYRADVADEKQRQDAMRYLDEHDLLPDIFIYSAAASMSAPIEHIREEHMRYLWEVNYFAMVRFVQFLLPHLIQVKGKIAIVGSMASVAPIPFDAHYSASKAAINAFVSVLKQEIQPYGVKVTAVLPGGTVTGFSFKRLIYDKEQCGKYYAESQKAVYTLGKMEQTGMTAKRVAELIQKHIDKGNGLYYPVGLQNGATYELCKHLPQFIKQTTIRYLYATDKQV